MHDLFYHDGPHTDDDRRFVLGPPPQTRPEGLAFVIGQVLADARANARLTSAWTLQDHPSNDPRSTFRLDPPPVLAVPSLTAAEAIAVLAEAVHGHGPAVACFGLFTGGSQTADFVEGDGPYRNRRLLIGQPAWLVITDEGLYEWAPSQMYAGDYRPPNRLAYRYSFTVIDDTDQRILGGVYYYGVGVRVGLKVGSVTCQDAPESSPGTIVRQ
jgi:hypothetical protein